MKLGIVISRFRRTGGLERVAVEWARGFVERGHDVTVFAQSFEERDDRFHQVKVGGATSPNWMRAATFPFAAARALRAHPMDVACSFGAAVLAPTVMGTAGPHRAWFQQGLAEDGFGSRKGMRRRLNPHHRVVLAMEQAIVGRGRYHRVLATSQRAADDWMRLYNVPPERCGVLENGVNLAEFTVDPAARERTRHAWKASDRFVVLSIANEVSRKGIDTLIRAFPLVRQSIPNALLVIGGPAGGTEAARLATHAGIASADLRLLGRVAEPAAVYAGADVFAFPTLYDPWGLVAVEALACGTPVVCSSIAGVSPHIRNAQTGILLEEPRDPVELARAIVGAASLPREGCRASVEHLSWDRILDRAEAIVVDVLAQRRKAAAA